MLVEIKTVNKEEVTVVTSLDVAETFGKEHYHVIEDIREIASKISTPEFSGLLQDCAILPSPIMLMHKNNNLENAILLSLNIQQKIGGKIDERISKGKF